MHVNDTSKRLVISLFWNIRRRREGGSFDKLPKRGKSSPYCQDVVSAGGKVDFLSRSRTSYAMFTNCHDQTFLEMGGYGVPESTLECILVCYFFLTILSF